MKSIPSLQAIILGKSMFYPGLISLFGEKFQILEDLMSTRQRLTN